MGLIGRAAVVLLFGIKERVIKELGEMVGGREVDMGIMVIG